MQFKLTLRCLDQHPVLPINYQYELSAWIYKVIQHADADYAETLHQRGHQSGEGVNRAGSQSKPTPRPRRWCRAISLILRQMR